MVSNVVNCIVHYNDYTIGIRIVFLVNTIKGKYIQGKILTDATGAKSWGTSYETVS